MLVVLLPILWYYSFNPQGFGLLPIFELLLNLSFFILGIGSSLIVLMRKDVGAKRALVIFGLLVFLVSLFSFSTLVIFILDHTEFSSPDAVQRLFMQEFEIILVNVCFIIAGARLLISGLFYVIKKEYHV